MAKLSDVADGIFHTFGYDSVAGAELLAVFIHMVAKDACLYAGSDFGGAAWFGSIADNAGYDSKGIDQGMGDRRIVSALQIGDAASGRTASADGAAVGR